MYEERYQQTIESLMESGIRGQRLDDEKKFYLGEKNAKIKELSTALSRQDKRYMRKDAPDFLLDPISFNLFVDPVISPSGRSYERGWILQHLKTSRTDPFSRLPLTEKDLIPNLALRQAAEVSTTDFFLVFYLSFRFLSASLTVNLGVHCKGRELYIIKLWLSFNGRSSC